ncbi:MAG: hypothetical protein PHF84_09210, partial [bacterium]|nr:hypothetical protein [bacterium]
MTKQKKNNNPAEGTDLHDTGKFNFLNKKYFIIGFYILVIVFLFFPLLMKPGNSPDSISQAYPAYLYNKAELIQHGSIPFWYPYISGGTPYLEGFHFNHLFDFLVYVFPVDLGIGYRYIFFVLLAGWLAYLFFQSLGFSRAISFIAGLVYMLSGDAVSYISPGHYGKIVNMAFLPLTLMFINYGFDKRKYVYFLFAGLGLSFMFRGHPQLFYYNILIISLYFMFKFILSYQESKEKKLIRFFFLGYGLMGLVAVLCAFDNLFHQFQFVKMTSRGTETDVMAKWEFATSWSKHPLELFTYFMPSLWGLQNQTYMGWMPFVSTTDYTGLLVVLIALFGIAMNWKNKYIKFFSIITVLAVLFGMGKFFPSFYKLFYFYVPNISKFRVPSTIYITVAFFLVYFFTYGLKSILEFNYLEDRNKKKIYCFIAAILFLCFCFTLFVNSDSYHALLKENLGTRMDLKAMYTRYEPVQVDNYINNILNGNVTMAKDNLGSLWIFSLLLSAILLLLANRKIKIKTFLFILTILIFIDLYVVDKQFITP